MLVRRALQAFDEGRRVAAEREGEREEEEDGEDGGAKGRLACGARGLH